MLHFTSGRIITSALSLSVGDWPEIEVRMLVEGPLSSASEWTRTVGSAGGRAVGGSGWTRTV